jgi:GIY-YIG catalytic domain
MKENILRVDYLNIYGISNNETKEIIYVGRTSKSLEERWWAHTNASSQPVNKYMLENGGFSKYSIELLKDCETYMEYVEWESHLILEMNPVCNVQGKYKPPSSYERNWPLISRSIQKHKKKS